MPKPASDDSSFTPLPQAGLLRRLAALVYDLFILFALTIGYGALLTLLRVVITGSAEQDLPRTALVQLPLLAGYWLTLGS